MLLSTFERRLSVRLARAEVAFVAARKLTSRADRFARRHQLEGALLDAWQAYCDFSREVCIHSALGCTRTVGVRTLPSIAPPSWQRASYVSIQAVRKVAVQPVLGNSELWKEPTWGDSGKLGLIIPALAPDNAAQLLAHFMGGLSGPKHCQIVRNAAAHKNAESLDRVRALAVDYVAFPISTATDALSWADPHSGGFAFLAWLDDMRSIGSGAIS